VTAPLYHGPNGWPKIASAVGFDFDPTRSADTATRNGSVLRDDGSWLSLTQTAAHTGDPLRDFVGKPGLWRGLRLHRGDRGEGTTCERVFDLPPLLGVAPLDERLSRREPRVRPSAPEPAWSELIEWADLTANGCAPSEWTVPPRDEVEQWISPVRLRVRAGAHAAEGGLTCDSQRLALTMPSLARISPDLSPARITWISELCHSAQEHWRLVRFGIDASTASVCDEVDLTGAPASCLPQLLRLAQAALATAAAWALPALTLASDPAIASRILDRHPERAMARFAHSSKQSTIDPALVSISN
jgi:hypothetical protein